MRTMGVREQGTRLPGRHGRRDRSMGRRVAIGGALGALPGLAVALVPLVLHELGVISADQSQIGFVGLPLLVVGTLVGVVAAVSGTDAASAVWSGIGLGSVVGLGVGVLVTVVCRPSASGCPARGCSRRRSG